MFRAANNRSLHALAAFAILAVAFGALPVRAQEMAFTLDEVISNRMETYVRAEGMITETTPARFEAFLQAHKNNDIERVILASRGGSLGPAMELGRVIRRHRLIATIESGDVCVSACAYAFLGGIARNLSITSAERANDRQAMLGFHRFAFDLSVPGALQGKSANAFADRIARDSQVTAGGLADYVAVMGADVDIIKKASAYGRGEFLFLGKAELTRLGVLTNYESDLGEFKLVPDRSDLVAAFVHEDHQFTLTCFARPGRADKPVLVMSQRVYPSAETIRTPISAPLKFSTILAGTPLPWLPRDLEHKHFHAHSWFTGVSWNPVFGFFVAEGPGDEDEDVIKLTSDNASFFSSPGMFSAIVDLPPTFVARLLMADSVLVGIHEHETGGGWAHRFTDDERDREALAYALRTCAPAPSRR